MYFSGAIEQIGIHKKMSLVLNVGLITLWCTSGLSLIFELL